MRLIFMLLKYGIALCIFLTQLISSAQIIHKRVQFVPVHPHRDQSIMLYYKPDSTIFNEGSKISCKIYFTGSKESEQERMDFAQVLDINLVKENGLLHGSFLVATKTTGMVVVFLDSLEQNIDNNTGEGYWVPLFNGDEPMPGALSGIADLYAGGWDPEYAYHLKRRKDVARRLYEEDFARNPQIKRNFTRYYLAILDINDEKDRQLFMQELDHYAQYSDLNEWELLGVSKNYGRINEIDSATKYQKLVFERYPKGSWALQENSIGPAMLIEKEPDHGKKKEMYNQFKEMYCKSYPDEFTRRAMESRRGQILQDMVLSFLEQDELDIWFTEVDKLDEEFKYYTYNRTSQKLIKSQNPSQLKKEDKEIPSPLGIESSFLTYKLSNDDGRFALAEKLSWLAIDWWRKNLDAPRRSIDRLYLTNKEVRRRREERLGEFLDNLGQSLLLQNKFEEAPAILKEAAVTLTNRTNAEINEHYIESLIKSNQIQEALTESETAIKLGKSTAKIDDFYNGMIDPSALKEEAMINMTETLRKQMVNEKAPTGILLNSIGEEVSIKDFKGKTIVIDFWATWCPPCIVGLESMVEVVEKYKDQGDVVFLFVNTERINDKTKERVMHMLKEKDYSFNVFFDPNFKTTTSFKVEALPTKIVIDRNGKIRFFHVGLKGAKQQQSDELIAMIELAK